MLKKFFYVGFILIFISKSFAEDNLVSDSYKTLHSDIISYPEFLYNNKLYTFGTVVLLGVSFGLDKEIRRYALKHQDNSIKNILKISKPFSNEAIIFPGVSVLAISGYLTKNDKLTEASITSLESGLVASTLTFTLKTALGRERPDYTKNNLVFKPFTTKDRYNSFPSGGATIAWAMVTPYAVYYEQPLLYIIPVLVDIERLYNNKHWTSDVIAGSAIGFSVGYLFSKNHLKKNNKYSITTDGKSLTININF